MLGAPIPPDVQGQSLLDRVTHPILAEEDVNPEFVAHYGAVYDRALRVLYDGPYKLIRSSRGERLLFDLATDPGEDHDLAAAEPERVAEMERRLDAAMAAMPLPRVAAR
jgi:arylsulfatase A-like enzyme